MVVTLEEYYFKLYLPNSCKNININANVGVVITKSDKTYTIVDWHFDKILSKENLFLKGEIKIDENFSFGKNFLNLSMKIKDYSISGYKMNQIKISGKENIFKGGKLQSIINNMEYIF